MQRLELGCLSPVRARPHRPRMAMATAEMRTTYVFQQQWYTPPVTFCHRQTEAMQRRRFYPTLLMSITARTRHGQRKSVTPRHARMKRPLRSENPHYHRAASHTEENPQAYLPPSRGNNETTTVLRRGATTTRQPTRRTKPSDGAFHTLPWPAGRPA